MQTTKNDLSIGKVQTIMLHKIYTCANQMNDSPTKQSKHKYKSLKTCENQLLIQIQSLKKNLT